MITDQADILITKWLNMRLKRLINTGTFKTIYYEFNNRFETGIDVEVRVGLYRAMVMVKMWGLVRGTCKTCCEGWIR